MGVLRKIFQRYWLIVTFSLVSILSFLVPIFLWDRTFDLDWTYFNALSLIIRSNVLSYHQFPLHDPWVCGGVDLLANPQSRIFSPSVLLDLLFVPHQANLLSLVIYAIVGLFGMFRLLRFLGISKEIAFLLSIVFINGTWFGLHYSEGHIAYGTFQLIPYIPLTVLRIENKKMQFLLFSLLAFFILDGGIYVFIFSLLIIFSMYLFGLKDLKSIIYPFVSNTYFIMGLFLMFGLLVAPKLVPTVYLLASKPPNLSSGMVPLKYLPEVFFYAYQDSTYSPSWGKPFRFHEYGCYIGLVGTLLILWSCRSRTFLWENRKWFYLFLFWFWVGSQWFSKINPWYIFQSIPIINHAHVPSRLFILMFIFFIILLAKSLTNIQNRRKIFIAVFTFLLMESFLVKNYPFFGLMQKGLTRPAPIQLVTSDNLERTDVLLRKPWNYYIRNTASKACYEPGTLETEAVAFGEDVYRGEVYIEDGEGSVNLNSYIPGRMEISYALSQPGTIVVNTNYLLGWKISEGKGSLIPNARGLVKIRPADLAGTMVIQYAPFYLVPVIISYLLGVLLFLGLLFYLGKQKERENESV